MTPMKINTRAVLSLEQKIDSLCDAFKQLTIKNVTEKMETNNAEKIKKNNAEKMEIDGVKKRKSKLKLKQKSMSKKILEHDENGNSIFHDASQLGRLKDLVSLFNEFNIDINRQNNEGSTPLILAVSINSLPCVEFLLSLSPDPNLKEYDTEGWSALHVAAYSPGRDIGITKALLSCPGIDITLKNNKGMTPENLAIKHKNHKFLEAFRNITEKFEDASMSAASK